MESDGAAERRENRSLFRIRQLDRDMVWGDIPQMPTTHEYITYRPDALLKISEEPITGDELSGSLPGGIPHSIQRLIATTALGLDCKLAIREAPASILRISEIGMQRITEIGSIMHGESNTELHKASSPAASGMHRDPANAEARGNAPQWTDTHSEPARTGKVTYNMEQDAFATKTKRKTAIKAALKMAELAKEDIEPTSIQEEASLFCKIPIRRGLMRNVELPTLGQSNDEMSELWRAPECVIDDSDKENYPAAGSNGRPTAEACPPKPLGCISNRETAVLKDTTNSPAKKPPAPEDASGPARFFLQDLDFLKKKKTKKSAKGDKGSKHYERQKRKNTRYNTGYKTVSPKKKVVVDIFKCDKSQFMDEGRKRLVTFDGELTRSIHYNKPEEATPILVPSEARKPSEFAWGAEREQVEIVKRLNLGYSASQTEELIFRSVPRPVHAEVSRDEPRKGLGPHAVNK